MKIQMKIRTALALAAALPLTACFDASTVIKVKADGSGTIEQRILVTDAALDQLRAFTILGGGHAADVDPTSEAQAQSLASAIGPGVTYVSSTPVRTPAAQGRDALYAFTDISQIRISEQPQLPSGVNLGGSGVQTNAPPITFGVSPQPNGNVVLRIAVPRFQVFPGADGGPAEISGPTPEQFAMARQVLAGARLTVAIEPQGRLVRTSSPYVDGPRVILIDVDVDQAASDPALADKLRSIRTLDDAKAAVAGVPGLKLTLDPEITIEFAPAR